MSSSVLFDEASIARRVESLANEMAAAMPSDLVVAGILTASFVFVADLVRALDRAGAAPRVEFLHLASYGGGRVAGDLRQLGAAPQGLTGRAVLIVDTVADTGRSLAAARRILLTRGAGLVRACILVDKVGWARVDPMIDFVGFSAPANRFLVGYGLDDAGTLRHRRCIATVT